MRAMIKRILRFLLKWARISLNQFIPFRMLSMFEDPDDRLVSKYGEQLHSDPERMKEVMDKLEEYKKSGSHGVLMID